MFSSTVHGAHRHDIVNGRHQRRQTSPLAALARGAFGVVKAAAILAIAISLGLVGTGGTYAYLNTSAPVTPGSTVSAGTATLSISGSNLNWTALAPGQSVTGTFTIENTGDVPLELSADIATTMTPNGASNPFVISVANGACPASGTPATTLGGIIDVDDIVSACLVVTLPVDAPASAQLASASIATTIWGVQP